MRLFKLIAVLLFSLWGSQVLAGAGHSHAPVEADKASAIATKVVSNLVIQKVIDSSWNSVKITNIEQKVFSPLWKAMVTIYTP